MDENVEIEESDPKTAQKSQSLIGRILGCWGGLSFGVIFPLMVIVVETLTGIGGEGVFLPMPTPLHMALVISMPVCNLVAWICCSRGWGLGSWVPRFLVGFALFTAIVYAVELLPFTFFGIAFCCVAFWWFGVGFLGLLPGMPLFAAFAGFAIRYRLEELAKSNGYEDVRGFGIGALAGGAIWLVLLVSSLITLDGLYAAKSGSPETLAKRIRIVRMFGREDVVGNVINNTGNRLYLNLPTCILGDAVSQEKAKKFYYRLYGKDSQYLREDGGRRRRRFGLRWDAFTGGEKVGALLEGLSFKGSAYDTKVEKSTGIGYAEWTMVFANSRDWGNQEARARIALPKGAVVSRLTLWVNGEEQEAAFAGKGTVRKAYESVVRRQRDPVLVNMCGPDQIQMQCFPVPARGEMKVRIGMTVPLEVAKDGKSARFPAPAIIAHNFHYDLDMLGLPKSEEVQFENPLPTCAVFTGKDDFAVVQKVDSEKEWRPQKMIVVVDTSASMRLRMEAVAGSLAALPSDIAMELWVAGDLAPDTPALESPAGDAARKDKIAKLLKPTGCMGGRDNVRVLCKALEGAAKNKVRTALVWMHGPEYYELEDGSVLPQFVRKAGNLRFYDCQVEPGECPAGEKLLGAASKVSSIAAEALGKDVGAAMKSITADWSDQRRRVVRSQVKASEIPSDSAKGDEHLARLWAYGETLKNYREGNPAFLDKAKEYAMPWHIVTPVTGAVVLESKEQFKDNGLEPVSSSSVPTVPEPSSVLCFLVVLFALVSVWWFKLRKRNGAV